MRKLISPSIYKYIGMYLHIIQLCLFSVVTEYLETFITSAGHND